jgi:hypothetical protein
MHKKDMIRSLIERTGGCLLSLLLLQSNATFAQAVPEDECVNDTEPPAIVPLSERVDLTTWMTESYDDGDWAVYDNGNSVQQNDNGLPTFFYSDFSAMGGQAGLRLTTHVSVDTQEDNDFIGIAVGFNPGDTTNPNADYLLIDWKQNAQNQDGWGWARAGLSVSRVKGISNHIDLWQHTGTVTEIARAVFPSEMRRGWNDIQVYSFSINYSEDRLQIYVDGVLEFDIAAPANDPFPDGRYAFYDFSQKTARFASVRVAPVNVDMVVECDAFGQASNVSIGQLMAVDNCDEDPILTNDAPAVFPLGDTIVNWTATDAAGNSFTFPQVITVVDTAAPVITEVDDITINQDDGECHAVVNFDLEAFDLCSTVTVSSEPASGSIFPVGTTPVLITAIDGEGNVSTSSFNVTVLDVTPPVLTIPTDILVQAAPGETSASVAFNVTAFDECSATVVTNPASGSVFNEGSTVVICTATDANGNVVVKEFTVTVITNQPPVAQCQDITVANDPGLCAADVLPALVDNGSFDPDAGDVLTYTLTPAGPYPVGQTMVTLTVTDPSGSSDSCNAMITVTDSEAPVLSCPTPVNGSAFILECDGTGYVAQIEAWANSVLAGNKEAVLLASDNCGIVSQTFSHQLTADCGLTGSGTVTFSVADEAGNVANCTVEIAVHDSIAPLAVFEVRDIYPSEGAVSFTAGAEGDACGNLTVEITEVLCQKINPAGKVIDQSNACEYVIDGDTITITKKGGIGNFFTITATVTDECGNASVIQRVVNVALANEGVGNGVDGNTPGHDNNGGNDDPQFTPGNPGGKNKKKS